MAQQPYATLHRPIVRTSLQIVGLPLLGFVLLNAAFAVDAAYQMAVLAVVGIVRPVDPPADMPRLGPWLHIGFLVLMCGASWLVWRSRLPQLMKAAWLVVPVAAGYAVTWILLYHWPVVAWLASVTLGLGFAGALRQQQAHWLYWYAYGLLTAVMAVALGVFQMDI